MRRHALYAHFLDTKIDYFGLKFIEQENNYKWSFLKDCWDVLDIGFGHGFFIQFAPKGKKLFGIDISEQVVGEMKKKGYDVLQANAENFSLKKRFDAIHAAHVLEHLENPFKALNNWNNHLKENGKLLLVYPDLKRIKTDFWKDYTHKFASHPTAIKNLLNDTGFKILKEEFMADGKNFLFIPLVKFLNAPRLHYSLSQIYGKLFGYDRMLLAEKAE